MRRQERRHASRKWVAAAGCAAFAVAAGVAAAAIPDGHGVIHACAKQGNGDLRVVDTGSGESCKDNEQALEWDQSGPPGAPGGVSGYQLRTGDAVTLGAAGEATVTCPQGTRALGGGYIVDPTVRMTSVIPAGGGSVWSAAGRNESDTQTAVIRARVVCAHATS
jgi:hypothetical protein